MIAVYRLDSAGNRLAAGVPDEETKDIAKEKRKKVKGTIDFRIDRTIEKLLLTGILFLIGAVAGGQLRAADTRPNILIAIADDQSYPHASAYGYSGVSTPAFDRVAESGVLFLNAFTPAPGCSPMRATFLTGRQIWQLEQAGTHASSFPAKYEVFPDRLEASGYFVGYTGKGWGPGNWKVSGRERNPAGKAFSSERTDPPIRGVSKTDYTANFEAFLTARPNDRSFCFWFGASEPHRSFEKGVGKRLGKAEDLITVPPFLPDRPEIRQDILDYLTEIEWFDQHLGRMLETLKDRGELYNTLVVVTSDNGMAFPRAKANVYEYGIHMPLAIAWPKAVPQGRSVRDLVSLIDVTATLYDVAGVAPPFEQPISGRSLMNILLFEQSGLVDPTRDAVFSGRERHSSSRYNTLGYPQRCVRTHDYLYIWNLRPERWPAGAPRKYGAGNYGTATEVIDKLLGPEHGGYHDIDACPTMDFLIANRQNEEVGRFLDLAVAKRPETELYRITDDPGCLTNLAGRDAFAEVERNLQRRLRDYLRATNDSRVVDVAGGEIWETYPRFSPLRWFPEPEWVKEASVVPQEWLEARRPKP